MSKKIKKSKFEISPSCYKRRCHPETCCCCYNYVVHDYIVRYEADTEEECQAWIDAVKESLK